MATQDERSQKARAALIAAGRELFGTEGYAKVTTPALAAATGMTRGALYHHFDGKEGLFEAVVVDEYARVERAIDDISGHAADPLEKLIEGGDAFITAMSDPITRQILLIDAPSVLGMARLVEIDAASTTKSLQDGIEHALGNARLPEVSAKALASLMTGAYDRAVIDGHDTDAARQDLRATIRLIWSGLARLS